MARWIDFFIKSMKLIMYHPQGNANVRASAVSFAEAKLLEEFHTSIACFPGSFLYSLGGINFLSEIRRRRYDPALKQFTHTKPFKEMARLICIKAGFNNLTKHESGMFCVEAVARALDKKIAASLKRGIYKKKVNAVYAYEDAAEFSFRQAKYLGLRCFYDLPTGYWRAKFRILEAEKKRFPEWQNTIHGLTDSKEKLSRKDEEIKMADRIFVASKFTASTLKDFPGMLPPVQIIPYGFPNVALPFDHHWSSVTSPIKLLFVGSLSQQKGIANLFEAVNVFGKKVSLTLVGRKPNDDCFALNAELIKHKWISSLPHHKILEIMREHDVLVFPTLFDGFGLVITEAMSQGTPVIATYNCGAPDVIEHGRNGWLAEAGSTSSLCTIIEHIIKNPDSLRKTGFEAIETARMRPWGIFMKELSDAIKLHD